MSLSATAFEPDLGSLEAGPQAIAGLLITMADDEFVIGFSDSEWTGIGPILEEDVAISSIAQDELGHAQALYGLLAELVGDGRDADAFAYDRPAEAYRHARLLDHPRGDWAMTIARRYLYETADAVRLGALAGSTYAPLRDLVAKIRREERYHRMHVGTWFQRLAEGPGEPRDRLLAALAILEPDAATVFAPLPDEQRLVDDAVLAATMTELEARWRASISETMVRLSLPMPAAALDPSRGRLDHSDEFRHLHDQFTSVRRSDEGATW